MSVFVLLYNVVFKVWQALQGYLVPQSHDATEGLDYGDPESIPKNDSNSAIARETKRPERWTSDLHAWHASSKHKRIASRPCSDTRSY